VPPRGVVALPVRVLVSGRKVMFLCRCSARVEPLISLFVVTLATVNIAFAQRTNLPEAVNEVPYDVQLHFRAVTPITVFLAGGTPLPHGLTLGTDGLINGSPTISATADFDFTVTVADSSDPPQTSNHDYRIQGVLHASALSGPAASRCPDLDRLFH